MFRPVLGALGHLGEQDRRARFCNLNRSQRRVSWIAWDGDIVGVVSCPSVHSPYRQKSAKPRAARDLSRKPSRFACLSPFWSQRLFASAAPAGPDATRASWEDQGVASAHENALTESRRPSSSSPPATPPSTRASDQFGRRRVLVRGPGRHRARHGAARPAADHRLAGRRGRPARHGRLDALPDARRARRRPRAACRAGPGDRHPGGRMGSWACSSARRSLRGSCRRAATPRAFWPSALAVALGLATFLASERRHHARRFPRPSPTDRRSDGPRILVVIFTALAGAQLRASSCRHDTGGEKHAAARSASRRASARRSLSLSHRSPSRSTLARISGDALLRSTMSTS